MKTREILRKSRMGRSRNAVKHLYGRALAQFAKLLGVPHGRRT